MQDAIDIVAHEMFRHDCRACECEWPKQFLTGGSYVFERGQTYTVPAKAAEFFIRAGWASKPGDKPIKPTAGETVVWVRDSEHGVESQEG